MRMATAATTTTTTTAAALTTSLSGKVEDVEMKRRVGGVVTASPDDSKVQVQITTVEVGDKQSVPRANVAAMREASPVTISTRDDPYGYRNRKKTVLEQHCLFFDPDNDGVIWPIDTWNTCRSFGWGIRISLFFACFLHLVQSWGTVPWFFLIPDPFFRVWIHNIHFNKHGSSTLAFDNEGRYRQEFLDAFFDRNDKDGKGGLTFWEGYTGLRRIRFAWDIFGQISAFFEWGMTYVLLWPDDGVIRKAEAQRVLDGSIFHELTTKHRKSKSI